MNERPSGWKRWFSKIETVEQAHEVISESAITFYSVAGILVVLSFFLGAEVLLDSALYVVLGLWLQKRNSRAAAICLVLFATLGAFSTGVNRFAGGEGGRNIILAVIVLWASVRAVQATFKLPQLEQFQPPRVEDSQEDLREQTRNHPKP